MYHNCFLYSSFNGHLGCFHVLLLFSLSVVSDSLWLHGLQDARLPCPSSGCSNSCPSSQWCLPTISSSVLPFFTCLQSFPASGSFPRVSSLHQVAKVLKFLLQHQFFWWIFRTDFLTLSQESSPTPQFKSINSSPLSFLYSSTLASIHDYWKNHSFD